MFLTKRYLLRRTSFRSLGATIALPLLDYTIPSPTALAQTAAVLALLPIAFAGSDYHTIVALRS